ncbi:MAG: hypothetical protein IPM64_01570 [Phycisphaerales bacterium]|nr:hypothetical protein [Phycisphaerales bacterium]
MLGEHERRGGAVERTTSTAGRVRARRVRTRRVRTRRDSAGRVSARRVNAGRVRTGRVHDWAGSRRIVDRAKIPVFLAGGLNASNVGEAIRAVRPFGIDLCSGVRTNGALNPEKLRSLVRAMAG